LSISPLTFENSQMALSVDRVHQYTLAREVSLKGAALFTGEDVSITLTPAPPNTGIVFQRLDLSDQPLIKAKLENVESTPRCTKLGNGNASVQTVEHLLAALRAFSIDNVIVKIFGPEVPIFDGSATSFIELIENGGVTAQTKKRNVYKLAEPVYSSFGDVHLVALPSDEFRLSYTLHFPFCMTIGTQYFSYVLDPMTFKREIAPCRTFAVYEEIVPLIEKGYIRGGGLDNAIVIKEEKIINPEALRFEDEMARHKILDLIGDLSLIGKHFLAHVIAIRSGHASNIAFAQKLSDHLFLEKQE
jgi:UDP-3-O-[3-hydroxymyristoyl] N-acetylglucosamine deacetylase